MYHASLTRSNKLSIQQEFGRADSSFRCLVATIAFGLVCLFHMHSNDVVDCLCV